MSALTNSLTKYAKTDKFVMPVIPEELRIDARSLAILHCVSFLELSGNETVDPDWSVEAMEHVACYLQRLSPEDIAKTTTEMQTIATWAHAQEMPSRFVELAQNFVKYVGLSE